MRPYQIGFLAVLMAIAGCGAPRIDGSSEESFKASFDALSKDMSPEEKSELGMAMMVIAASEADLFTATEENNQEILKKLHGKTAKQIIEQAQTVGGES